MTTQTQSTDLRPDVRAEPPRTAFVWSAGGWLGAQFGSTLWMALLGFALLSKDVPSAVVCLSGFALANAIGTALWRSRERRSAYAAIQTFLAALTVLVAILVAVVHARGASEPASDGIWASTYLPVWIVAFVPAMMAVFHLRERRARRSS